MLRPTILFAMLAAPSTLIHAQSAVALDGHLNLGFIKESGRSAELGRGYNNWLRLKTREQLEDDLTAGVTLEMRYRPDTGTAENAALFQGESTVSLDSARYGAIRLGRAMSPLWQQKWRFEPWFDSEFMGSLGNYQSGSYTSDPTAVFSHADWARIPGAVFYDSAESGGFSVHLGAAVKRPAGASGRTHGASLNYASKTQQAMLSFEENNRGDTIAFLAGSWMLPALTLMASITRTRLTTTPATEQSFVIAARIDWGPGALRFGLGHTGYPGTARKHSAGYIVALSSRTNLYADLYRETTQTTLHGTAAGIAHMF
ncbi:MAG: porin [Pseudomonadota bacterium]